MFTPHIQIFGIKHKNYYLDKKHQMRITPNSISNLMIDAWINV